MPKPIEDDRDSDSDAPLAHADVARARTRTPRWMLIALCVLAAPWLYFGAMRLWRTTPTSTRVATRDLPLQTREPWIAEGFIEMVPPIRLPSRVDGGESIEVWVKLPPQGKLGVRWIEAQHRHALTYPAGAVADRLELLDGVHIVDVRGTELGAADEETFHVYRDRGEGLREFSWRRGDVLAQGDATTILVAHEVAEGRTQTKSLERNNACGPCHAHAREERRAGVPARQTDAAGWFVPETVLRDRAPLEHHRPRDMNVDAPFVRFECPAPGEGVPRAAAIIAKKDGTRWPSCGDAATPIGVYDVAGALAAGDEHAKKVCASRRALGDRMDDEARRAFARVRGLRGAVSAVFRQARACGGMWRAVARCMKESGDANSRRDVEPTERSERSVIASLAAGLAHEIRNPLNSATLHLRLLEGALKRRSVTEDDVLEPLGVVAAEVRRLALLVDEFLTYARPAPLERAVVSAADLCARAAEAARLCAVAANVEILLDVRAPRADVLVDAAALLRALGALVENAIDAVTAVDAGGQVMLRAHGRAKRLCFEVQDDGGGFASDAPIFDPFYSTKRLSTGLGLAVARRIVVDHEGSIEATSKPGRTLFRVQVPLHQVR